ncbi:hypothetical protein BDY19DRAFT_933003 [Irpex rosettiformis]|uniref:Uncharacterized protein n=1 Tax=Irpex rosettiformis TaxID=378272 RepID=A0ACB8UAK2_9APHY|nr:hypothetical protein BDY19DRAFT_933003 [Irpex rosettiformis]
MAVTESRSRASARAGLPKKLCLSYRPESQETRPLCIRWQAQVCALSLVSCFKLLYGLRHRLEMHGIYLPRNPDPRNAHGMGNMPSSQTTRTWRPSQ